MISIKINRKPVALILLALVLCLAVFFTACNDNSAQSDDANTEATATPEVNATAEPEDYGTFTAVIPDNGEYENATANDLVEAAIVSDILAEKNVVLDINVIPVDYSDYFAQINSLIASGQSVECIVDDYSQFDVYMAVDGLCVSIDDLLSSYGQNILSTLDTDIWSYVTYNNLIYAIPGESLEETTAIYVRQDVLDMMGLNSIVTKTEFNAALVAFSTLSDSGITPLAINYDQALDVLSYLWHVPANDYAYQSSKYQMREQDKYFDEFLDMLKEYYENGYIPSDFFDITEEEVTSLFTSGLAMMYVTEYTEVAEDYEQLLSVNPDAEVSLVTKPTHQKMQYVKLSAETPVSSICIFTTYGSNHAALMTYLDWMISDVNNYETTNLGILGTMANFNNLDHEYEILGEYADQADYYNGIFSLGLLQDGIYSAVVPINGDSTTMTVLQLQYDSYAHLSTAAVMDEGTYTLSEEAEAALSYYRFNMDEAIRRYITGEITYAEYCQYYENNKENASIVTDYLTSAYPEANGGLTAASE